jgi:mono/diheme cytochrome c family protein
MTTLRNVSFVLAVLFAGACSKAPANEDDPAASSSTTTTTTSTTVAPVNADAKAKEIFAQRCTPCHGNDGRGDGAASASLNPRPRNFHDPEWQSSVTDDHLQKIIQYGGAAVGKSAAMPANPDLKDAAVVQALAAYIRQLGKSS